MKPIQGVTQVTTVGDCPNTFTLAFNEACTLNLDINRTELRTNINGGPIVCQQGTNSQCYQPTRANILNVTKIPVYTVGGSVGGLSSGNLVLQLEDGTTRTITHDGPYTFNEEFQSGDHYFVTVKVHPTDLHCSVSNRTGTITNANVTNVNVHCALNTYPIKGAVTGLINTKSVVLQNEDTDNTSVQGNGSNPRPFTFSDQVAYGGSYKVTVLQQPEPYFCTVNNGSGTVTGEVNNVAVICDINQYPVGGTVSGLKGTVVLANNGNTTTLNQSGNYTFPVQVKGSTYNITVQSQPSGQTCTPVNASGTVTGVVNVAVKCLNNPTQLTASLSNLTLSVTGRSADGSSVPTSGKPRFITITNTGNFITYPISVNAGAFPPLTTISSDNCSGAILNKNESCTITIKPGPVGSLSSANLPCGAGTGSLPVPTKISVGATNTNQVPIDVTVLNYGCIYQNGYVYALIEQPDLSKSIHGRASSLESVSTSIPWSTISSAIYGISETSIKSNPIPSNPPTKINSQKNCEGKIEGACDTDNTTIFYSNVHVYLNAYAAGLCKSSTAGKNKDWYLPSMCEMTAVVNNGTSSVCMNGAVPLMQNIAGSLPSTYKNIEGNFWTSTQSTASSTNEAWYISQLGSLNPTNLEGNKSQTLQVICSRTFIN